MSRPLTTEYLESLLDLCYTDRQREVIRSYIKHGTAEKASKELGIAIRNIRTHIATVKKHAASKGLVPEIGVSKPAPNHSGLIMNGASVYHQATPESPAFWAKYKMDGVNIGEMFEAFKDSVEDYKVAPLIPAPKQVMKNKLVVYPQGDPHIGMFSWSKETGENFDCKIAENDLREAMTYLVSKTPAAETAIILNLGDFFHSDNKSNRTEQSGNALDVDGRWSKVLQIGITLMIDCVYLALKKHKKVIVKNVSGNHDDHTSKVLSICMQHHFRDNSRVEIHSLESPFFFYEFGNCMIGSTHGHMVKPKQLHGLVANYEPAMWGRTQHRYFYLGHFHHKEVFEEHGLTTEIFNTLASQDAWHHSSGFRSKRNMCAIVLDKEFGEEERYTFSINRKK